MTPRLRCLHRGTPLPLPLPLLLTLALALGAARAEPSPEATLAPSPSPSPGLTLESLVPEPIGPPAPTTDAGHQADDDGLPERAIAARIAAIESARRATVEIVTADEGRRLALGTLFGTPPVAVTKASELETLEPGELRLRLHDEALVAVRGRLVDKSNDLAVLEPAVPLPGGLDDPATADPAFGSLVLSPLPDPGNQRVGVVGALPRLIEKRGGVLGVRLGVRRGGRDGDDEAPGVSIDEIYPDSAAAKGGLLVGDRIVAVDETPVPDSRRLQREIFSRDPGDTVVLGIRRGEEELDLPITLGYWSDVFDLLERNQRMSGATSRRKTGFESVIQHDIPLEPADVGGPLLDLQARLVGLNIARQDRVTSFAIPARVVARVVASLRGDAAVAAAAGPPPPPAPEDDRPDAAEEEAGDPAAAAAAETEAATGAE